MFYYTPWILIDRASQNDVTSLTKYTMHSRVNVTQS